MKVYELEFDCRFMKLTERAEEQRVISIYSLNCFPSANDWHAVFIKVYEVIKKTNMNCISIKFLKAYEKENKNGYQNNQNNT